PGPKPYLKLGSTLRRWFASSYLAVKSTLRYDIAHHFSEARMSQVVSDEIYCTNMSALFRADPRLAQRIDEIEPDGSVQVEPSRRGPATGSVQINGSEKRLYLHSRDR